KRAALLHALEDEVDAESRALLHAAQRRQNVVLFPHALPSPFDRDGMVAGVGFHPVLVVVCALTANLFIHNRNAENRSNEMNHLFGPRQPAEIAVDDNAVEAVIYKNEQAAKQLCESLHRSSPSVLVSTTRSSDRRPVVSKFQISLARTFSHTFQMRSYCDTGQPMPAGGPLDSTPKSEQMSRRQTPMGLECRSEERRVG